MTCQSPSSTELHLLLDQKIQEVARMRSVLAKELKQVNLISSVKQQIFQSGNSFLVFLKDIKGLVRECMDVPVWVKQINQEWGRMMYEEKLVHSREIESLRSKYKSEVMELETQLRKQYEITHSMKSEVEGLKRLIDEYMNENDSKEKQKQKNAERNQFIGRERDESDHNEMQKQKRNDTSPIKSMSEERPPTLEIIIQEEEITSTKRGEDPEQETLQTILERARTEEKIVHKEYITLGNLQEIIRTNSSEKGLAERKIDLNINNSDIYYKGGNYQNSSSNSKSKSGSKYNYGTVNDESKSEITISEGVFLNDVELENLSKMISKNMEKKLFSNRRISAETKNATSKDILSFLDFQDVKFRGLHSFRDIRGKENEDWSREKDMYKDRIKEKEQRQGRNVSKQQKYKAMIKNILTKKEKQVKKKKEFVLNIGGEQKMEVDYEGQKKEGKKHGKGVVYYKNGLSYEGQFKNGQRDGHGTLRFNHIQIYNGEWQSDTISGEGRVKNCTIFASKRKDLPLILQKWISYTGGFKNNRFQGSGTLFMPGGQKYLGMFRNGYPCNEGTLYKTNGEVEFGQWKGDNFVKKC